MSAHPCPRLFQVEAMRDGRLTGLERASFERHLSTCSTCSREADALETLAQALRASARDRVDELHVRRERTRLLASFYGFLVPAERRGATRRLLWPAAGAALVVGCVVAWRVRPGARAAHPSNVVIRADGATAWSEHVDADDETVTLEHGALWIHIDHSFGHRRLVVVLPDGELEDTGTTFTVNAEDHRTTRVTVLEGRVVLRIRGRPSVTLVEGDTWGQEGPPAVSGRTTSAPLPATSSREERPIPTARSTPSPRSPAPLASAPDPSVDFRAAMAALDIGDNCQAAAAFASFSVEHPRDPRAEDAAYMRVVALQRCGDKERLKEAALEYLRRYPAGFRHREAESLSR